MAWDGTCFIGFEHADAQQDPADPLLPPNVDPVFGGVLAQFPGLWTNWEGAEKVSTTTGWAHQASGFGGTRSLRMALDTPGFEGDPVSVEFACGNGSQAQWEIRFYVNVDHFINSGHFYIYLWGPIDSALHGYVFVDETGEAHIYKRGPPQTLVASSGSAIWGDGGLHEIKLLVTLAPAGQVALYVDGVVVVQASDNFDGDTSGAGLGAVLLTLDPGVDNAPVIYIDDFMAFPAGTLDADTEYFVLGLNPSADSEVVSTPTGASVTASVGEDGTSVDTTSNTVLADQGDIDLLTMETLVNCTVVAVMGLARCRSSDATVWEVDMAAKYSGTTSYGTLTCDATPSTEDWRSMGAPFLQAPGAVAWTRDIVNASTFGYRATTGTSDLQVAWFGVEVLATQPPDEPPPPAECVVWEFDLIEDGDAADATSLNDKFNGAETALNAMSACTLRRGTFNTHHAVSIVGDDGGAASLTKTEDTASVSYPYATFTTTIVYAGYGTDGGDADSPPGGAAGWILVGHPSATTPVETAYVDLSANGGILLGQNNSLVYAFFILFNCEVIDLKVPAGTEGILDVVFCIQYEAGGSWYTLNHTERVVDPTSHQLDETDVDERMRFDVPIRTLVTADNITDVDPAAVPIDGFRAMVSISGATTDTDLTLGRWNFTVLPLFCEVP